MAVQSDAIEATGPYDRARALSAFKLGDVTFYWLTRACAVSVLLILGGIIVSLIVGAWPAMKEYGLAFLWTQRWAPSADPPVLGALGPIYGTLITSVIAMMIAIPVGLGIAILNFSRFYNQSPSRLWATIIASGLLGILFFTVIALIERLVVRWKVEEGT